MNKSPSTLVVPVAPEQPVTGDRSKTHCSVSCSLYFRFVGAGFLSHCPSEDLFSLCQQLANFEGSLVSVYQHRSSRLALFVILKDNIEDFSGCILRIQRLAASFALTCLRERDIPSLAIPDRFNIDVNPPYYLLRSLVPLYGPQIIFPAPAISPSEALYIAVEHYRHYVRSHIILAYLSEKRYRALALKLDDIVGALVRYYAVVEHCAVSEDEPQWIALVDAIKSERVKELTQQYLRSRNEPNDKSGDPRADALRLVWNFEQLLREFYVRTASTTTDVEDR